MLARVVLAAPVLTRRPQAVRAVPVPTVAQAVWAVTAAMAVRASALRPAVLMVMAVSGGLAVPAVSVVPAAMVSPERTVRLRVPVGVTALLEVRVDRAALVARPVRVVHPAVLPVTQVPQV